MRAEFLAPLSVALALVLTPASSAAAPAKRSSAAPAKAPKVNVGPAVEQLKSTDEATLRAALNELRIAGPSAGAATPAIVDVLARGVSEPLTVSAIETLGDLESESASPMLGQYATHRTVKIRRAAVKALTRTKGPSAEQALRRALGDADAQVRGTAASGLGALKATHSVADLFLALDHRVNEAAASIGQLCDAQQCEQLAGKLGKLPFDVVTGGLESLLYRTDLADDAKIKVLERLRGLGTGEANRFLKEVEKRLPKTASARLRSAVDEAVRATTGGSQ